MPPPPSSAISNSLGEYYLEAQQHLPDILLVEVGELIPSWGNSDSTHMLLQWYHNLLTHEPIITCPITSSRVTSGYGVWGLGFGVWGLGFRVYLELEDRVHLSNQVVAGKVTVHHFDDEHAVDVGLFKHSHLPPHRVTSLVLDIRLVGLAPDLEDATKVRRGPGKGKT